MYFCITFASNSETVQFNETGLSNIIVYMKHNFFTLLLAIVAFSGSLKAQDPHFSQFYLSPLGLNPALTGMFNNDYRVVANYRSQWGSVTVPYQTMSLSADGGFLKKQLGGDFVGGGLYILNDQAGDGNFRNTQLSLNGAYHKSLNYENTSFLTAGVQLGMVQRSLDFTKLFFDNQFDGDNINVGLPSGETNLNTNTQTFFDVGAGLNWTLVNDKNSFYLGAAAFHLLQPANTFLRNAREVMPRKFTFSGGAELAVGEKFAILPQAVAMIQGPSSQFYLGGMLKYKLGEQRSYKNVSNNAVSFGAIYRVGDAAVPMLRLDLNNFTLGLSYDVNVSSLVRASSNQGGPEVAIQYRIGEPVKNQKVRCPAF